LDKTLFTNSFVSRISLIYLSTETAGILGVLGDFHLLNHFTQRGTITGTVLASDSDLLCTLGLKLNNTIIQRSNHVVVLPKTNFSSKKIS